MSAVQETIRTHTRWMIRHDVPEVLGTESATAVPWDEETLLSVLRARNCIGMVAEVGEKVVGHLVYRLHAGRLELLRLVVRPAYRRRGVGSRMVRKLINKLSAHHRAWVTADVNERCEAMLYFLRAQRFLAAKVIRNGYGEDDGVRMEYGLDDAAPYAEDEPEVCDCEVAEYYDAEPEEEE